MWARSQPRIGPRRGRTRGHEIKVVCTAFQVLYHVVLYCYCTVQYVYSPVRSTPYCVLLLRYCIPPSPVLQYVRTEVLYWYLYLQHSTVPSSCRIASCLPSSTDRTTLELTITVRHQMPHDDKVPGRTSIGQPIRGPDHPEPPPIPPCFHFQKRFSHIRPSGLNHRGGVALGPKMGNIPGRNTVRYGTIQTTYSTILGITLGVRGE